MNVLCKMTRCYIVYYTSASPLPQPQEFTELTKQEVKALGQTVCSEQTVSHRTILVYSCLRCVLDAKFINQTIWNC